MFYTQDEYDFQVAEQIAAGLSRPQALARVDRIMAEDEREYMIWADKLEEIYQREDETGDRAHEYRVDFYERDPQHA